MITGLRVRGYHGVFDHERRDGQDFLVDATVEVDTRAAAATDELSQTVDYAHLASALAEMVAGPPVQLLETLASGLVDICLRQPGVHHAQVTVHKPDVGMPVSVRDVAVTVERRR